MEIIRSKEFKSERAWGAKDIANMDGITTRLHWTDQPYKWHVNDGEEVFVVLDGTVKITFIPTKTNNKIKYRLSDRSMDKWRLIGS